MVIFHRKLSDKNISILGYRLLLNEEITELIERIAHGLKEFIIMKL